MVLGNESRASPIRVGGLLVLVALGTQTLRAEPLAAYMYVHGAGGVPTVASQRPATVGTVYLKAVDIDSAGTVLPKFDDNGRFYPDAWTTTPKPRFAALINADPAIDWGTVDPAVSLTLALSSNDWQQDYDAGITVDAEFSAAIDSFPQNWQDTMIALRSLANDQGQNFSLYVSPKYLSSDRYPATAAANAATLAQILGTPAGGITNSVLFPVYIGGGVNADQDTLDSAAAAARTTGFDYQWIFDITEATATFNAGLQAADQASGTGRLRLSGYVAYAFSDTESVSGTMTTNIDTLASFASVPEPGALAAAAVAAAGLATAARGRRR